jgi:hypothetical protein
MSNILLIWLRTAAESPNDRVSHSIQSGYTPELRGSSSLRPGDAERLEVLPDIACFPEAVP